MGSLIHSTTVLLKNALVEINSTGSRMIERLDNKEGGLTSSTSCVKFMGLAGTFFKVMPNIQPDKSMAGIEITIPHPSVVPISAPSRCVTK